MRGRGDEGNVAGCPSAQRESSQRYGTWDSHTPSYLCPPRADTSNAPAAYKYSELRGCRGRCRTGGGHPQRRTTVVSERPSSDVALLLGVLPLARAERLGPLGAALRPALKQGVDLLQSFPCARAHKYGCGNENTAEEDRPCPACQRCNTKLWHNCSAFSYELHASPICGRWKGFL